MGRREGHGESKLVYGLHQRLAHADGVTFRREDHAIEGVGNLDDHREVLHAVLEFGIEHHAALVHILVVHADRQHEVQELNRTYLMHEY